MKTRTQLVLAIAVTAGALSHAATVQVRTYAMRYAPSHVQIQVGDTVEFLNAQRMPHTVTADPTKAANASNVKLPKGATPFDSGVMKTGGVFTQTFTVPGDYQYLCTLHEEMGMIGTIKVVAKKAAVGEAIESDEELDAVYEEMN